MIENKLRAQLAVHVYGDVCGETVQCLTSELSQQHEDIEWELAFPASDALVSRLRSQVVTDGVQAGYDVQVWLDHDMVWTPGELAGLVRRCAEVKGVVGGLVPFRSEAMFGRGFAWRPHPEVRPAEVQVGVDRLVPADKVGGAFVALWMPAVRQMIDALEHSPDPALKVTRCRRSVEGFFWDVCRPVAVPYDERDELMNYLSEDWALLMRLQSCGTPVFAWTLPFIRHVGRKAYGAGDALGFPGPVEAVENHLRGAAMAVAARRQR